MIFFVLMFIMMLFFFWIYIFWVTRAAERLNIYMYIIWTGLPVFWQSVCYSVLCPPVSDSLIQFHSVSGQLDFLWRWRYKMTIGRTERQQSPMWVGVRGNCPHHSSVWADPWVWGQAGIDGEWRVGGGPTHCSLDNWRSRESDFLWLGCQIDCLHTECSAGRN